jgi:hypothetical protein
MKGNKMKKLLFILAISVMISACGRDFKSPTQDTEPEPGYLSSMNNHVGNMNRPGLSK